MCFLAPLPGASVFLMSGRAFCSTRSFQPKQRSSEANQSVVWSVLLMVGTGLGDMRTRTLSPLNSSCLCTDNHILTACVGVAASQLLSFPTCLDRCKAQLHKESCAVRLPEV